MSCTGDSGVPAFFFGVRLMQNTAVMLHVLKNHCSWFVIKKSQYQPWGLRSLKSGLDNRWGWVWERSPCPQGAENIHKGGETCRQFRQVNRRPIGNQCGEVSDLPFSHTSKLIQSAPVTGTLSGKNGVDNPHPHSGDTHGNMHINHHSRALKYLTAWFSFTTQWLSQWIRAGSTQIYLPHDSLLASETPRGKTCFCAMNRFAQQILKQ